MLSIIIPVYCVENTLDRCLESIVSQSYADVEIILVDDGSPDRSPALCDAWAQRDPRIHVIHQENKGLSCARNAGIEMAQGDFLTFIDSDDYIEAETLAQVMAAMADNDIVEYPVDGFCGGPNPFLLTFQPKVYDDMEDYWLNGRAYEHAYAWNKIYRRTLFDHVRYPEGRVFEDIHTLPQLLQQARRIATTNQGLYHYCWNDKGITATADRQALTDLLEGHLKVKWVDDRSYMRILNIQIDVYERGGEILLPKRDIRFSTLNSQLSTLNSQLKALLLKLLGVKGVCQLFRFLHTHH